MATTEEKVMGRYSKAQARNSFHVYMPSSIKRTQSLLKCTRPEAQVVYQAMKWLKNVDDGVPPLAGAAVEYFVEHNYESGSLPYAAFFEDDDRWDDKILVGVFKAMMVKLLDMSWGPHTALTRGNKYDNVGIDTALDEQGIWYIGIVKADGYIYT